jgi:hypothetical protein
VALLCMFIDFCAPARCLASSQKKGGQFWGYKAIEQEGTLRVQASSCCVHLALFLSLTRNRAKGRSNMESFCLAGVSCPETLCCPPEHTSRGEDVIFRLLSPTQRLPSRRAKADQVTTSGRGYQIVVAIRNFHNQSPFIFHKENILK